MKKKNFDTPKYIERKYVTLLNKLLKPIKKEALKYTDDISKFKAVLKNASKSKTYKRKTNEIVKTISTMLLASNSRSWREAARKSSRGKEIKKDIEKEIKGNVSKRMEELFKYNATLIETLPLKISEDVIRHINSEAFKGKRSEDISKEIKKFFPHNSSASAKLIARTETSKFSSALTQARSEDLGVYWYVWRTSEDVSVRSSHKIMEGVLVNYKHPASPESLDKRHKYKKIPSPYHAGNIYNCRCYQEPLIDLDDINWPHKVYNWKTKQIEVMTLSKFRNEFYNR
jgi:SPP1 gp7 family putative phage head morphogenesis protein